jgi:hypothetical protein
MSEEKNKFSWDLSGSTLSFNDAYKTPLTLEESLNNISFRLDINGNLEVSNEYGEVWNSTLTANKLLSLLDINSIDITNWDTAYGWGDHSTEGYITGYTETDPVFLASPAGSITDTDKTNWNTAYEWGDHSIANYAVLTGGKLNPNVLPSLAITETFVVVDQAAMLALTAERGDVAIRTDINKTFILSTDSPTTLPDWKEILTPAGGVTSVQVSVPIGLVVNTQPITSTGTIEVGYASGYSIPTSIKQSEWDKAYQSLDTQFSENITSRDRFLVESFDVVDLLTFSSEDLTPASFSYTKSLSALEQFSPGSNTYNIDLVISFTTDEPIEGIFGTLYLLNDDVNIGGIDFGFYNIAAGNNTLEQELTVYLSENPTEFDAINIQFFDERVFSSIVVKKLTDSPSLYKAISSDILSSKAPIDSPQFTGTVYGITAGMVGLGNVTNESKATMFTSPTFTGIARVPAILEKVNVSTGAANSIPDIDLDTAAVWLFTGASTANWTLNFRASFFTSMNTRLATGQSATVSVLATNTGTAYRPTGFQVDGSNVTVRWQGGTAPSAGNVNSIDVYTFTIVKTASSTYTVLGSQTRFA